MSFACIGVLVACMLLIGGAAMISLNVTAMVNFVEDQNEVSVFLLQTMTPSDAEVMGLTLKNMDNIARVTFISKEEALEALILENPDLFLGLDEGDNFLPDKYIVQIDDLARMEETLERIGGLSGIEKVNASTDVAKMLVAVRQAIAWCGAGIVAILVVVSIVIITNNIKLTIFSRRREINIMKYVGATDTFIRMPFLIEGMVIGLISAALAFLVLGFGYTYLMQWIGERFGDFLGPVFERAIEFWSIAHYMFGAFAALGVLIGMAGSGFFVRKHLRV
jgi:cell division transport system permease protein